MIKPVLSDEEWAAYRAHVSSQMAADDLAKIIARANYLLPDEDHRKLTRERIAALVSCVESHDNENQYWELQARATNAKARYTPVESSATVREARAAIDALNAYLPPEPEPE